MIYKKVEILYVYMLNWKMNLIRKTKRKTKKSNIDCINDPKWSPFMSQMLHK